MASRWGQLPRTTRDRYASIAENYGLSRSAARGRYNRGTWNPARQVPRDQRGRPLPYVPLNIPGRPPAERYVSPMAGPESTAFDDAFDRVRILYGDRDYFNQDAIEYRLSLAGPDAWEDILGADDAQLFDWSSLQDPSEGGPAWLWVETDAGWVNVLWYK